MAANCACRACSSNSLFGCALVRNELVTLLAGRSFAIGLVVSSTASFTLAYSSPSGALGRVTLAMVEAATSPDDPLARILCLAKEVGAQAQRSDS